VAALRATELSVTSVLLVLSLVLYLRSGRFVSPQANKTLPLDSAASCSGIMAAIISVSPSD